MPALITLDDLKARMPIRGNDGSYDLQLTELIEAVSERIETACRRQFTVREREDIMDVLDGSTIEYDILGLSQDGIIDTLPGGFRLPHTPVDENAPFRVYYDRFRMFGPATQLDPSLITLLASRGRFFIGRPLHRGNNVLKVVYSAGSDAPPTVRLAAIEQCVYDFKRTQYENAGSATQNNDDGNAAAWASKGGLLPSVLSAIGPYRKLLRGRG